MRKIFPYPSDRAMLGAIADEMICLEKRLLEKSNREIKQQVVTGPFWRFWRDACYFINHIVNPKNQINHMDEQKAEEIRESILSQAGVGYVSTYALSLRNN